MVVSLLVFSEYFGYSFRDLLIEVALDKPNITCALEFPVETEKDQDFQSKRSPEVVIRNNGPLKALSVYWDVKVYQYDSAIDDIIACSIQGLKSLDHAIFRKPLNPSDELRHSTVRLSGNNVLAIYVISVVYYVKPNNQPINLKNYFFVEKNRILDSIQFKNDRRYDHLMEKVQDFDISQTSTTPVIGVDNVKTNSDEPTIVHVPPSPAKVVKKVEPPVSPVAQPLSVQVYYVYRAGGTGPLLPITSGEELSSGDHYKIFFKANRDCYVYVYQTDANGQIFRLFPLKQFGGVMLNHENPVKAEADYVLPAKDRFFFLDDTIGKEKMVFIASIHRNVELEALDNKMKITVQSKNEAQISSAWKDMAAYLSTGNNGGIIKPMISPITWQSSDAASPVLGHLFKNIEENCFHEVEFFHR